MLSIKPSIPYLWQGFALALIFFITAALRPYLLSELGTAPYIAMRTASFFLLLLTIWYIGKNAPLVAAGSFTSTRLHCGDPLLFVRLMACIFVLLQHGMGIAFVPEQLNKHILHNGLWLLYPSAWMGVWIFYVLSGYLMGKAFFSGRYTMTVQGIGNYYKNRLLRIVPLYYLAVLLVSAAVSPDIFKLDNIGSLLSVLSFDNAFSVKINPIGALWSVAVEMQFYFVVPLFAALIFFIFDQKNSSRIVCFFIGLLLYGLAYRSIIFIDNGNYWLNYVFTPFLGNLDLFLGGMIAAYCLQRFKLPTIPVWTAMLIMLGLYIACSWVVGSITAGNISLTGYCYLGPTWALLSTSCMIFILETAVKNQKPVDFLSSNIIHGAQFLGLLSYPIYICHEPIYLAGKRALGGKPLTIDAAIYHLLFYLLIVLAVAILAHYIIEKTTDRFKAKESRL